MSLDKILGGIVSGGIAMNKVFNDNSDQRIKEQAAEEAKYKFEKQKTFDTSMEGISTDEENASKSTEDANKMVSDPESNNKIMQQALDENAAGVAAGVATALTDEQKVSLKSSIDNQNLPLNQKISQVNQAKAVHDAVSSGKASTLDSINNLEAGNRSKFDNDSHGIAPDPVNKFRFSLKRAAAFNKLGDYKSANEIKKVATFDATSDFASAILSGDRSTAFEMYQTFPNGHYLKNLRFGKDASGDDTVITEDISGNKVTSKRIDILLGALSHSGDPEKAIALLSARLNQQDKNEIMTRINELKENQFNKNLQAKYDLDRGGNGGGSGSGKGSNKPEEGFSSDGTITLEAYFHGAKADAADPLSSNKMTQSYQTYQALAQNNPQAKGAAAQWDLANTAKRIESRALKVIPELMADGTWDNGVKNGNGVFLSYQKGIVPNSVNDPTTGKPFFTTEKIISTIQTKFPDQYDSAMTAISDPDKYKLLTELLSNPRAAPQAKQQAQLVMNLANQIKQYKGGKRIIAGVNTPDSALSKSSNFSSDELSKFSQLGITPNKPVSQAIGETIDKVADNFKQIHKNNLDEGFQYMYEQFKSGDTRADTANAVYNWKLTHPDFKLTPDEDTRMKAYSTDYQTRSR